MSEYPEFQKLPCVLSRIQKKEEKKKKKKERKKGTHQKRGIDKTTKLTNGVPCLEVALLGVKFLFLKAVMLFC